MTAPVSHHWPATGNDDHDLKLVYSCMQEEADYNSGLHRTVAAVRLGFR